MTELDPLADIVHSGWPSVAQFIAVTDPVTVKLGAAALFSQRAVTTYVVPDRPTMGEAHAIAQLATESATHTLVGIGSGVVLDTVKLAAARLAESGTGVEIIAVPCGPEPYRAVTGFAMYDDRPGVRTGIYEPWFRAKQVHVVADLLEEVDPTTFALLSGDSLVHALESLLSRACTPESEGQAKRAANIFIDEAFAPSPNRSLLIDASMRAAIAFEATKLGLAHALSRPMGIAAECSHDRFNLMLGASVVWFWGDQVLRASPLVEGLNLDPTANLWVELLDHYQALAGLPRTLSETPLSWAGVIRAQEWAPNSSGIPHLPHPVTRGDIATIVERAWDGHFP